MDHEKKLAFVHQMTKLGLKHFDGGGVISAGSSGAGPLGGITGAMTVQNGYSAEAPTSASTVGQQQASLAGQLQDEAAGNGPNPAQQQYRQNTQAIAQQQAGNYAANRALNPGLAARMAGNTAANIAQTAAGTAGIQQAQQQLAAQQQMEGLTGQEQQGALQAEGINSQIAQNNANAANNTQGGVLGGIGSAIGAFAGLAKGGDVKPVKYMAEGGSVLISGVPNLSNADALPEYNTQPTPQKKPQSPVTPLATDTVNNTGMGQSGIGMTDLAPVVAHATPLFMTAAKGGMAQGPKSSAGQYLSAKKIAPSSLMKSGGSVKAQSPSEKAVKKDDSLQNDKVPAMLSAGEIVIPRHITQHPNAPEKAAQFVAAVLAKKRVGKR